MNRRTFIRASGGFGVGALLARPTALEAVAQASAAVSGRTPDEVAGDEAYWGEIRRAFALDRTLINLNNGNSSPSPEIVHNALKLHLDTTNLLPAHHRDPIIQTFDTVRRELATEFGCDAGELALTRNTTEAMHIAQCGIDVAPGDEVVTTDQDYTRMLWAWDQRARRDKVVIRRIQFPVPTTADDLVARFEKALTPRTKVLHFCHMTNTTGQIFPVRELSRLARSRGIVTIVDGAQTIGHIPVNLRELECDVYGTSLHKWLMAPQGTGFLYVRRDMIEKIWPLQPALDSLRADIRKFAEVGTQSVGARAAIADALAFHRAIGVERKAARLRYLTMRWIDALKSEPRIRILSSVERGDTFGVAALAIDGMNAATLVQPMLEKYRIVIAAVVNQGLPGPVVDFSALRVTPNIYTTPREIDTFVAAIRGLLRG